MTIVLSALFLVHGLIHLMGFAKAFGFAELPQLTQSIPPPWGAAWLLAAVMVVASAAAFATGVRWFWMVGAMAVVLSQVVIASAWRDAWAGSVANALLLAVVVHGFLTEGPASFSAQMRRDVAIGLARPATAANITDADLAPLPEPVRQYLRLVGVVGQPRVVDYRVRFHGRIRSDPGSRWMPFEAEQHSFADDPTRLFLMRARMFGIPVQAFHRSVGGHATMQVKVLGVFMMVDARGDEMDRAEAVTLFNDMSLLAPGTLLDPRIAWEPVDAGSARARFTHGGHTVTSTLMFGEDGLLKDFVSDDRLRSVDGRTFTPLRFSTPLRDYRQCGPLRLASHGDAQWTLPEGPFTYGEFDILDVAMNPRR